MPRTRSTDHPAERKLPNSRTTSRPPTARVVSAPKPKLKLPPSPVALAFRHIVPTWRAYVQYVDQAAREGDKDMARVRDTFMDLPRREQETIMPEQLCDLSGVKPSTLVGAVVTQMWDNSQAEARMITSIFNPQVLEKTAKRALNGKEGGMDRENWLKGTGFIPTPKGGGININTQHNTLLPGAANANQPVPVLKSAAQSVLDYKDIPLLDGDIEDVVDAVESTAS